MVIDWLPFETSQGEMTFGEYRKQNDVVRFVPTVDQFRQVARVAQAHGLTVINAGYTYDAELLGRAEEVMGVPVERVRAVAKAYTLREMALHERRPVHW